MSRTLTKAPVWEMVSWMKERKGIKRQMHFSNNWVRYCSLWEAVVAGGEKIG